MSPHPAICGVLGAAGTDRHIPSLCRQLPHCGVQRLQVVHEGRWGYTGCTRAALRRARGVIGVTFRVY